MIRHSIEQFTTLMVQNLLRTLPKDSVHEDPEDYKTLYQFLQALAVDVTDLLVFEGRGVKIANLLWIEIQESHCTTDKSHPLFYWDTYECCLNVGDSWLLLEEVLAYGCSREGLIKMVDTLLQQELKLKGLTKVAVLAKQIQEEYNKLSPAQQKFIWPSLCIPKP